MQQTDYFWTHHAATAGNKRILQCVTQKAFSGSRMGHQKGNGRIYVFAA